MSQAPNLSVYTVHKAYMTKTPARHNIILMHNIVFNLKINCQLLNIKLFI